jgi:hypothetical protein
MVDFFHCTSSECTYHNGKDLYVFDVFCSREEVKLHPCNLFFEMQDPLKLLVLVCSGVLRVLKENSTKHHLHFDQPTDSHPLGILFYLSNPEKFPDHENAKETSSHAAVVAFRRDNVKYQA